MVLGIFKNKFVRNSFMYTVGILAAGFLGYVFQVIVSRKLSIAQYGEFQSLMSSSAIFGVVSSAVAYFVIKYGSVFSREQDFAGNNAFLRAVNARLWRLSLLLLTIFFLAAPLLRGYLRLSDYWGLFFIGATLFVGLAATSYGAILSGWQMFKVASVLAIVAGFLKLFAGIIGTWLAPTSTGIIFALFVVAAVSWLIGYLVVRKKFYEKADARDVGDWKQKYFSKIDIKKSIAPIAFFSLAVALMQNIDVLLVKNLTSAEITGHYAVLNILGKIIFWVNGAIIAVVLPAACANGFDNARPGRKLVWTAYGLIGFVSFCGIMVYFIAPNFTVSLLFGAKYLMFAKELWLFGLIALSLSFLMLEANFSYARHDFRISYVLSAVILLMVFLIQFFHETIREVALSIACAMALGFVAAFILNNCQVKKVVKKDEEA